MEYEQRGLFGRPVFFMYVLIYNQAMKPNHMKIIKFILIFGLLMSAIYYTYSIKEARVTRELTR